MSDYKIVCISLYSEDIERIDGIVSALKARGIKRANRSAVIRFALDQVDTVEVADLRLRRDGPRDQPRRRGRFARR